MKKLVRFAWRLVDGFFELLGRAQKGFLIWLLSYNPNNVRDNKVIRFSWADWKTNLRLGHFTFAGIALILAAVVYAFTVKLLPATHYSIFSALANVMTTTIASVTKSSPEEARSWVVVLLFTLFFVFQKKFATIFGDFPKFLREMPQYMMVKEQTFRQGAETMSWGERLRSCVVFGASYFTMLLVPLAAVPALAIAGAVFMLTYAVHFKLTWLQVPALKTAASVHIAFNLLFFALLPILIVLALARS